MIRAFPGGWDGCVGALATTRDRLENRIYERKGQQLHIETAMIMQKLTGTTFFAEAVAVESGGVFVKNAHPDEVDNDVLHEKFQQLYKELGELSATYSSAIQDNHINKRERAELEAISHEIQRIIQELMTLMFRIYCRDDAASSSGAAEA